ncbi:MAG: regulatory protein RecX [Chitinophagaceae bacterium]
MISTQVLTQIKSYCAYQERCHEDVRIKLLSLKVYGNDLEEIIALLIQENFLHEERFARSYARGKFYLKKWGRKKIIFQLKAKKISPYCIQKAMTEIHEEDYWNTLQGLIEKKKADLKSEKNKFIRIQKIQNYLVQKGFEYELIQEALKPYFK